jgi:hypothetical protein
MDLSAWISTFTKLHEKARKNELDEQDLKTYHAGREELARALVAAQRLTVKAGETQRQALRVARAVQIDLDLSSGRIRALTLDISLGGFSSLIEKPPLSTEAVGFTLRVPGVTEPVIGRCKLVETVKRLGNSRCSFAFQNLNAQDLEKIEMMLFDSVIEQFKRA